MTNSIIMSAFRVQFSEDSMIEVRWKAVTDRIDGWEDLSSREDEFHQGDLISWRTVLKISIMNDEVLVMYIYITSSDLGYKILRSYYHNDADGR